MPNVKKHLEKAKSNREFLNHIGDTENTRYPEWYVIVSFYIAMHYLEAVLCEKCALHAKSHEQRSEYLRTRLRGKLDHEVILAYDALQIQSRHARYEAPENNNEILKQYCRDAQKNLEIIETECKNDYLHSYLGFF